MIVDTVRSNMPDQVSPQLFDFLVAVYVVVINDMYPRQVVPRVLFGRN